VFDMQRSAWATGRILMVEGRVERYARQINVMATQVWPLR